MNTFDELKQALIELQGFRTQDGDAAKIIGLVSETMIKCITLLEADQNVITQQTHLITALLLALQISSSREAKPDADTTPQITLPIVPDALTLGSGKHPNITRHVGVGSNDPIVGKPT